MNKKEINAIKCLEVDMLDNKQIEIILNLIKKQQKEIEELKKHKEHEQEYQNGEVFSAKQIYYIEENYIDKDKIREKIEKYEKDYERQDKEELFNMTKITAGKLSALQELLEE